MAEDTKAPDKKEDKGKELKNNPASTAAAPAVDTKAQELKDLLAKTEISLLLDSYDDIFSDFDPRPFSQRALSDDFLSEARRAARDKIGTLELRFIVPAALRKPEQEAVIKRRIREHFKRHAGMMEKEEKKEVKKSILMTCAGFVLMMIATTILYFQLHSLVFNFIIVFLEPGGWFLMWTGLDHIFFSGREGKSELEFYTKMSRANITFSSF